MRARARPASAAASRVSTITGMEEAMSGPPVRHSDSVHQRGGDISLWDYGPQAGQEIIEDGTVIGRVETRAFCWAGFRWADGSEGRIIIGKVPND